MNLLLVKTLFWVIMRMNLLIKKSGQLRFYVEEKKDPRSQTEDQGWDTSFFSFKNISEDEISLAGTDPPCRYSD